MHIYYIGISHVIPHNYLNLNIGKYWHQFQILLKRVKYNCYKTNTYVTHYTFKLQTKTNTK